ncbi:MAG TPA: hypothetical protein VK864_00810, partial [Longimicrobiales bacterium]|nr:hypothetical protein [Longimicrobiales bacterium]
MAEQSNEHELHQRRARSTGHERCEPTRSQRARKYKTKYRQADPWTKREQHEHDTRKMCVVPPRLCN